MERARYDEIGTTYSDTRHEDPRLAQAIWEALGDARSIANIGAGTGNYEPRDRDVIAIEPSEVMLAQRPPDAAPAIQGTAEQIPLADASVDAAMAVFTDQHWDDCVRGLSEMQRIARRRVVALTIDHRQGNRFWLIRDYLTEYRPLRSAGKMSLYDLAVTGHAEIRPVLVPADCEDGFFRSYWRRPSAYLDPTVRAGISVFHRLDPVHVGEALDRLGSDLESGVWQRRNRDLLELDEDDLGVRLVIWPSRA